MGNFEQLVLIVHESFHIWNVRNFGAHAAELILNITNINLIFNLGEKGVCWTNFFIFCHCSFGVGTINQI